MSATDFISAHASGRYGATSGGMGQPDYEEVESILAAVRRPSPPQVIPRIKRYDWMDLQNCWDLDPGHFEDQPSKEARNACATCPVIEQCRSLTMQSEYGFSAGLTAAERKVIRAEDERRAKVAA